MRRWTRWERLRFPDETPAGTFTITIKGRGGHAAWPHEAVDNVVVASNLIMKMQTQVSREIDPVCPAVVAEGRIRAGTTHNVIAEKAVIDGAVRSTHPETRHRILRGLRRMIQGISTMSDADVSLQLHAGLPALINEEKTTVIASHAAVDVAGDEQVVSQGRLSFGGEDCAFSLHGNPGYLFRFGVRKEKDPSGLAHSSRFNFDEDVLAFGAAWLARGAVFALQQPLDQRRLDRQ